MLGFIGFLNQNRLKMNVLERKKLKFRSFRVTEFHSFTVSKFQSFFVRCRRTYVLNKYLSLCFLFNFQTTNRLIVYLERQFEIQIRNLSYKENKNNQILTNLDQMTLIWSPLDIFYSDQFDYTQQTYNYFTNIYQRFSIHT